MSQLNATGRKNQFPQRKNIKIMYSATKIYLALHENLFLASPKTSFCIAMKRFANATPHRQRIIKTFLNITIFSGMRKIRYFYLSFTQNNFLYAHEFVGCDSER